MMDGPLTGVDRHQRLAVVLDPLCKLGQGQAQGFDNALDRRPKRVAMAALESADCVGRQAGFAGKGLLGNALALALSAQDAAKDRVGLGRRRHGHGTLPGAVS